jgi:hypothetical protein
MGNPHDQLDAAESGLTLKVKNFGKLLIHVTWGVMVSLPFFAPIPFYYTLRFGVIPWLVIDGETSIPGDFMWGPFKMHLYLNVLVISVVLWVVSLVLISRWVRRLESNSFLN